MDTFKSLMVKVMVNRYLGQLIETPLSYDQIAFGLTNGHSEISQLSLNCTFVNEFLTTNNAPLRLTDGFVGKVSVDIPWTTIMHERTKMVVDNLQLTFVTTNCRILFTDPDTMVSMMDSFMNGLGNTEEFVREAIDPTGQANPEHVNTFASIIDKMSSRFFIEFHNITIRFEMDSKEQTGMCTSAEIQIEKAWFMDEQMRRCDLDGKETASMTSQTAGAAAAAMGLNSSFNKSFTFQGVKIYTDVFTKLTDLTTAPESNSVLITSMHIRREKAAMQVPSPDQSMEMFSSTVSSMSAYQSCYDKLTTEKEGQDDLDSFRPCILDSHRPSSSQLNLFSDPIKVIEFDDEIVLIIRVKNSGRDVQDACVEESRIETELIMKSFRAFTCPSQLHILKSFFGDAFAPVQSEPESDSKPMDQEDYEAIVKNMEEANAKKITGNIMERGRGNWQQEEEFKEFDSINLEEPKSRKSVEAPEAEAVKEEHSFKLSLGTLLWYIPHCDYMSVNYVQEHGDHEVALSHLRAESKKFFAAVEHYAFTTKHNLEIIRDEGDKLYPKDHLRIVSSSITGNLTSKKFKGNESVYLKLLFAQCDVLEYLSSESAPGHSGPIRLPILDFCAENGQYDTSMKLIYSTSADKEGDSNVELLMESCTSELDLSIVDRISDLIVTTPFFEKRMSLENRSLPQLRDDIYPIATPEKKGKVLFTLKCGDWCINLRIPKADLRDPNGSRIPFAQRHVHDEYIKINFKDVQLTTPTVNNSTVYQIMCNEISADFCGDQLHIPQEQQTFLFGQKAGIDKKVKIVVGLTPDIKRSSSAVRSSTNGLPEEMMTKSSHELFRSNPKKEGPFSKTPRSFATDDKDNAEIIQAGTREEILSFQRSCHEFGAISAIIDVPILRLHIPEQAYLEVLYNRLVNDLALFQPAAPSLRPKDDYYKINPIDHFQECSTPRRYESDESDAEDESPTVRNSCSSIDEFDRSVPHAFVASLNVQKCTILCNTAVREKTEIVGTGQIGLDLENVHLGTTAGYHGDMNHTYFHFTSSKAGIGSSNKIDGSISRKIEMKDFGRWMKDKSQLEHVGKDNEFGKNSTEDAFAVALHMQFRPEINVKDVLLAIAIRNSMLQARPSTDSGQMWAVQLVELFTLKDYAIPGYELPQVSTDLHVQLDNAILSYDHSWVVPDSRIKLKAVFGQCNLSSTIMTDMNISKTLCIFEKCAVYMSNAEKDLVRFEDQCTTKPKKAFVQVLDIGLIQVDINLTVGPEIEPNSRRTPAFEIKCKNDLIQAWVCADSLSTLAQVAVDLSTSEKLHPKIVEEPPKETDETQSTIDDGKSTAGESCWSEASSLKHVQKLSVGDALPQNVDEQMRAMIQDAIREDKNSESMGIAMGEDAVEEFRTNYKPKVIKSKNLIKPSQYWKPNNDFDESFDSGNTTLGSDEGFCLVDDNVYGSGITNKAGEPRVRYLNDEGEDDETEIFDLQFNSFPVQEESRNDGLPTLPACFPLPVLRYHLKDLSVRLHLYAGNDLSDISSQPRTYSTEEYKNGRGPEQKIDPKSVGGKHRDHSASVVLECNKLSYVKQVFDKSAPLMVASIFSIGDIVIKDKVKASDIQEMLYQFACTEKPRRSGAPILSVRMSENHLKEGKMRVSMLPIKINVDQDTLEFLSDFFEETFKSINFPKTMQIGGLNQHPVIEVPAPISHASKSATSSVDGPSRMYPSLQQPSLNMEPLKPSPVIPTSPLGDLSYLDSISKNKHSSPVKRPIIDAPLTASAVSIGAMFSSPRPSYEKSESEDSLSDEEYAEVDTKKNDPLAAMAMTSSFYHHRKADSESDADDDDMFNLGNEWTSDAPKKSHSKPSTSVPQGLKPLIMPEYEPAPIPPPRACRQVDDILSRSTMTGSIRPMTVNNLVDTSVDEDDDEDHGNFLDGLDDSDSGSTVADEQKNNDVDDDDMNPVFEKEDEQNTRRDTFFKEFVFSPSVNIYVDYQGKRKISVEKSGAIVGLLMAFGQLNKMPITLREIKNRNGLLGAGKCYNLAIHEWTSDLLTNMPSVIASYGPISPFVQIGKGIVDLFWMPVEEFRKEDGHVVKGIQKGVGSFSVSSAAGIVGMAQTVTGLVQSLAEMTMREIRPEDPNSRTRVRRYNRNHGMNPTDIRHSLQLVYGILHDGYQQTKDDLELAAQEDRASGNSVVRSAFRYAVPTFLGPVVMATQVTYQLLGGLRNQLRPDAYQDERRKWGADDVPGGVGK